VSAALFISIYSRKMREVIVYVYFSLEPRFSLSDRRGVSAQCRVAVAVWSTTEPRGSGGNASARSVAAKAKTAANGRRPLWDAERVCTGAAVWAHCIFRVCLSIVWVRHVCIADTASLLLAFSKCLSVPLSLYLYLNIHLFFYLFFTSLSLSLCVHRFLPFLSSPLIFPVTPAPFSTPHTPHTLWQSHELAIQHAHTALAALDARRRAAAVEHARRRDMLRAQVCNLPWRKMRARMNATHPTDSPSI
jgi:hypothetical protein